MDRLAVIVGGLLAVALASGTSEAATIALVSVGDAGNAPDTEIMNDGTTGYGSVAYGYRIGKYEVTNGQYREHSVGWALPTNNAISPASPFWWAMPTLRLSVQLRPSVSSFGA